MGDIANITLSKDLIEPIVRAQLQASITAALGRSDLLVQQVVTTMLNEKVDRDGKRSSYRSDTPLITWMAHEAIRGAAMEAIKEWFADNKDEMKKLLRVAIVKNAKGMSEAYVLSVTKAVESTYKASIEVYLRPKGDLP